VAANRDRFPMRGPLVLGWAGALPKAEVQSQGLQHLREKRLLSGVASWAAGTGGGGRAWRGPWDDVGRFQV